MRYRLLERRKRPNPNGKTGGRCDGPLGERARVTFCGAGPAFPHCEKKANHPQEEAQTGHETPIGIGRVVHGEALFESSEQLGALLGR